MPRCCICNKELSRWIESEGKKYCSDECFKKSWPKCACCGKPMQQWLSYPGGKKFCSEECAKKTVWPKCHVCGKRMDRWQEDEHGHKYCSEACFSQTWPKCAICGKAMKEWKVDENGIKFCSQECLLQACPTCEVCGKHMLSWKCYEDGKKYCSQHCLETKYPGVIFQELPDKYGCFDVFFRDVETDGRKAGYIEAAQKYDGFLELLHNKEKQVLEAVTTSQENLKNVFVSLRQELDFELSLRAPKIETLLEKYKGKVKREEIMKQLEFNPECPFQSITFSECCLPFLFFGVIGIAYSARLAKFKKARIAGWQDARKVWKKKIDAETSKLSELINSGNQAIQEIGKCISELIAYKTKMLSWTL